MLHEHTAYWLYRHRGVPAPLHTYARVRVNGTDFGLHGVVETMDEQFLKRHFPHDSHGNLYEGNVSDFLPDRTEHFEIEESDGLYEPFADLDAVIATLQATPPEDFLATLTTLFDLDELLKMWAIEIVTTNVDGYAWFANNYMAYHDGEDKWHILPWGHDQCLEWYRDVADFSKFTGSLVVRCGETPECRQMLDDAMIDLVTDWQSSEIVGMVRDETALVQPECAADPRAELPCDTAHVLRFVQERPLTIHEELAE
jgi:spore coat protein CotH